MAHVGPGAPQSPWFHVRVERNSPPGVTAVWLSGELDLAGAGTVDDCLAAVVESDPEVVVDLRELAFIDSSGLRSLVRSRKNAAALGHTLTLRHPGAVVAKVLAITGLDEVFAIER